MKGVIIQKDSFPIQYTYEFHCASMNDVPEILDDVFKHGFYVRKSQAVDVICNQSNKCSLKSTFEKD